MWLWFKYWNVASSQLIIKLFFERKSEQYTSLAATFYLFCFTNPLFHTYLGYRSSGFQLTSFSMEQLKRGTLMEQSTAVGLPPSLSIPNIHSLLVSVTWPIVWLHIPKETVFFKARVAVFVHSQSQLGKGVLKLTLGNYLSSTGSFPASLFK